MDPETLPALADDIGSCDTDTHWCAVHDDRVTVAGMCKFGQAAAVLRAVPALIERLTDASEHWGYSGMTVAPSTKALVQEIRAALVPFQQTEEE